MGTSTSSRGPGGGSPLVPPWADTDGQGPGPAPAPARFRGFRQSLGRFVQSGERRDLERALGHYARTATGGHVTGSRRFGSIADSGGDLFDVLSALRDRRAPPERGVDLLALDGVDTDVAIERLVEAVVPSDGDADRVRVAMTDALSTCLEGKATFDFAHITDDLLVEVMVTYVANGVFEQVVLDSRDAFARARAAGRVEQAERALQQLVRAAADKHLQPVLSENPRNLTGSDVAAAQVRAVDDVWKEWEAYEP